MSRSTIVLTGIADIKAQLSGVKFKSLEDLLRRAMRLAHKHWLVTDEDERFQVACGVALLLASPKDKERIERE